MSYLYKKPNPQNIKTGNVTLSYKEFDELCDGVYDGIVIADTANVPYEEFMVDCAKHMNGYVIVPVYKSSFLVKQYLKDREDLLHDYF